VFDNRALRKKMFGPKEEEVTGDLRRFYNEVPLGL
jgi:hypothetical protein